MAALVDLAKFRLEALEAHNAYRRQHRAPDLILDSNLCNIAQKYAQHLAATGQLQHSSSGYGENLYYAWSSSPAGLSGATVVDNWYSEIKKYNFTKCGFALKGTGHFTQVVWKSSAKLGIGVAVGEDEKTIIVVGNYDPPGNNGSINAYAENVLSPKQT